MGLHAMYMECVMCGDLRVRESCFGTSALRLGGKERNFWTNFLALFDLVVTLVALTQYGARNLMAGVLWDALAHTALAHPI